MKTTKIILLAFISTLLLNCKKDDVEEPTVNQAPSTFNLLNVANGATEVELMPTFTWQAATDPDGDKVTYALILDQNPSPTTVVAQNINGTSFALTTPLSLLKTFYWKVRAKDTSGNTTESNTFSFTTRDTHLVGNEIQLTGIEHEATEIDLMPALSWQLAADLDGDVVSYTVLVDDKSTPEKVVAEGISESTFTLQERLPLLGTYFWKVIAKDTNGNSIESDVFSFTTRGLSITPRAVNENAIESLHHNRREFAFLSFDGFLWIIGGYIDGAFKNDVWRSNDDGVTWEKMVENAAFAPRRLHRVIVHNNELWLFGGSNGPGVTGSPISNEVWKSADGINWSRVTTTAPLDYAFGGEFISFNDAIWYYEGTDGSFFGGKTWRTNDGLNWTVEGDSFFYTNFKIAEFNNALYRLGGGNFSVSSTRIYKSSNGFSWSNEGLGLFPTSRRSVFGQIDNHLWATASGILYYSSDGVNWTERGDFGSFDETRAGTLHNNKIFFCGRYTQKIHVLD